jgi:serine/threonine protein kinase
VEQMLGEGASGIICKASWLQGGVKKEAAIKIFKGSVTSDGLPEDELNACIAAGAHTGLIPVIGQVTGHPEHKKGLVMELIPEHFYNLGQPPSFESCTRDVFGPNAQLTEQQVVKIAYTIASVAAHLHTRGIMHGDMYAHNTLTDDKGDTLFGDFGAACFYDRTNKPLAFAMERLEVSAYGYLLDDLLSICKEAKTSGPLIKISTLKELCIAPGVSSRPSFEYLENELEQLQSL